MEPAMVVCAGIATATLALGIVGSLPGAARRLGAIDIPIPLRPVAVALVMVSVIAAPIRPKPASATVAPPIVRLADAADVGDVVPATPSPTATHQTPVQPDRPGTPYIVKPGDCLWRIAKEILSARRGAEPPSVEIARFWPAIYEANRSLIGDNPNLIHPGQSLQIPKA